MMQDNEILNAHYREFIKTVAQTGQVWGLISDDGWASAESNLYEEAEVIMFWSTKDQCAASAKEEWAAYEPDNIEIGEFLESWCVGMHNDASLAGTDWGLSLFGKEAEPLQLALDLASQLIQNKTKVDLLEYTTLQEYKKAVVEAIRQEKEDQKSGD